MTATTSPGWLRRLGRRRLPETELLRHDAFLSEMQRHGDAREHGRWLDLRSKAVHAFTRLFGGGPTLAKVGLAGLITAVGSGLLTVAPAERPEWISEVPIWAQALTTIGVFGLAIEAARSPRRLDRRRFMSVACLPISLGTLVSGVTLRIALFPDWFLKAGLLLVAAGLALAAVGALRNSPSLVRRAFVTTGFGLLSIALCDGPWSAIFGADGEQMRAVGSGLSAIGCLLLALGFLRARPDIGYPEQALPLGPGGEPMTTVWGDMAAP